MLRTFDISLNVFDISYIYGIITWAYLNWATKQSRNNSDKKTLGTRNKRVYAILIIITDEQ